MKFLKIVLGLLALILGILLVMNLLIERSVQTEIVIDAPKTVLWEHLMTQAEYPSWNPFIIQIEGSTEVGQNLKVNIQVPGQDPMAFEPRVLVNEEQKELRWIGKVGVTGVFDGVHYFMLEQLEDSKTKFVQGEIFTGILSGMFMSMSRSDTEEGFASMNEALKQRSEN